MLKSTNIFVDITNLFVYSDEEVGIFGKGGAYNMSFLITLDAARVNAGYTIKEASVLLGLHHETLSSYEKDSSKVSFAFIEKASKVYHIPKAKFFIGDKYEFIRNLREQEIRVEV